jgi:hypothetical protein
MKHIKTNAQEEFEKGIKQLPEDLEGRMTDS